MDQTQEPRPPEHSNPTAEQSSGDSAVAHTPSRLTALLSHPRTPFMFLGAILLAALAYFSATNYGRHSSFSFGGPNIVLFDPVKFSNAQRAAVSILQNKQDPDLALTMTQVAKHAEAVIREEAGGAIVLVKQTVVVPDGIPDITDQVLRRFGLSTTVPTVTVRPGEGAESLEAMAPTDSSFSAGKLREDYLLQLGERNARIADQQETRDSQANVLP